MSLALPMPSQRGHMPPAMLKLRLSVVPAAALDRDRPGAADRWDVEREGLGPADVRLPEPAEDDPEHRVGVGGGADGGADVGAHPLLVEDDRRRQPFERVDVGPRQRRHEALHERAVGLVDQPLRFRGDRAEHQRALARARNAGEHGQPALRDVEADVLEVVLARAADLDGAPVAGQVSARRLLHELGDLCLRARGQLGHREGDRPHGAVVEARVGLEAEGRVADLELRLRLGRSR